MIKDVVSPVQEINYLRSFTSEEPQRLVDNYRKRQQSDPVTLLDNLWKELERRFGSAAVIANALLERMQKAATFHDQENTKLQTFADLCAGVESQMSYLPGLACLNFPYMIQPLAEKLPPSLRGKWEKEIAKHAKNNADTEVRREDIFRSKGGTKNSPLCKLGRMGAKSAQPFDTGFVRGKEQ